VEFKQFIKEIASGIIINTPFQNCLDKNILNNPLAQVFLLSSQKNDVTISSRKLPFCKDCLRIYEEKPSSFNSRKHPASTVSNLYHLM